MSGSKFDTLMDKAENLRENKGEKEEALDLFLEARGMAEGHSHYANSQGQVILSLWHLGRYDEAREECEVLLAYGNKHDYPGALAQAYRHLSRPEITSDGPKQVEYAGKAFEAAEKGNFSDLVWYAHGAFEAAFRNDLMEDAQVWLDREETELERVLNKEVELSEDALEKNIPLIWKTGFMMDTAAFTGDVSVLQEARQIAEEASLPLRVQQIDEQIDLMTAQSAE